MTVIKTTTANRINELQILADLWTREETRLREQIADGLHSCGISQKMKDISVIGDAGVDIPVSIRHVRDALRKGAAIQALNDLELDSLRAKRDGYVSLAKEPAAFRVCPAELRTFYLPLENCRQLACRPLVETPIPQRLTEQLQRELDSKKLIICATEGETE